MRHLRRRRGATGTEYGLLVGLVGVALLTAVGQTGRSVGTLFDTASEAISLGPATAPPAQPGETETDPGETVPPDPEPDTTQIVNGNFADGAAGWVLANGTSIVDNQASFPGSGTPTLAQAIATRAATYRLSITCRFLAVRGPTVSFAGVQVGAIQDGSSGNTQTRTFTFTVQGSGGTDTLLLRGTNRTAKTTCWDFSLTPV